MDDNQNTKKSVSSASSSQVYDLNDQLLKSVYDNDLNRVKKLLSEGADINAKGSACEGNHIIYTPLILAAEKGDAELFKTLLQTPGIDVNQRDDYGYTALHEASKRGDVEIIELLLDKEGIDVNVKDKYGNTPLILGVNKGHEEIVQILLGKPGILVNEKNDIHNHTALHLAADTNFKNIAKSRYTDILEALLSHPEINVNVKDKHGQIPLHTAAYHGNLRMVAMLLNAGANANEKTNKEHTAVHWAEKQGHVEVVKMIIHYIKHVEISGGNRKSKSNRVDDLAKSLKDISISRKNQSSSKEVNEQLLLASKNGDLGKVEELLKQSDIDVNCTDRYKENTPLHFASEKGHVEIVKVLLKVVGIEVNAKNKDTTRLAYPSHIGDNPERHFLNTGITPLYLAVIRGHLEVVKVLVNDPRTDVNIGDKYGKAPLHEAVSKGSIGILEILLSHPKIDVNIRNMANDHFTALHSATESGKFEIVKMLLNHPNINVNLEDKYYACTPLQLARKKGYLNIVKLF